MKKILWYFISMLVFMITGYGASTVWMQRDNMYYGNMQFQSVDEVLEYQRLVLNKATELNAKVIQSDITIQSPPRYIFNVKLPDETVSFPYGELLTSHTSIMTYIYICWAMGILGGIFCCWWVFRKPREE